MIYPSSQTLGATKCSSQPAHPFHYCPESPLGCSKYESHASIWYWSWDPPHNSCPGTHTCHHDGLLRISEPSTHLVSIYPSWRVQILWRIALGTTSLSWRNMTWRNPEASLVADCIFLHGWRQRVLLRYGTAHISDGAALLTLVTLRYYSSTHLCYTVILLVGISVLP